MDELKTKQKYNGEFHTLPYLYIYYNYDLNINVRLYTGMSRNFITGFLNLLTLKGVKRMFYDTSNTFDGTLRFAALTIGIVGHGIYAYSTESNNAIVVTKKYKMNRNGFTDFMIIDNKGRHFNVNNSFWYWKWDSIEDWHRIEENKQTLIKYYGWRIPLLGLFPNITLSNRAHFLDSMTSAEFRRFEAEKLI
ncbi:MAG: hypothetical protein ACOVRN_19645 [Flavobacterium sp.]